MIKYNFLLSQQTEDFDSKPCIHVNALGLDIDIDNDLFLNSELNHLSSEYIREVVKELEEVKSRERETCIFGYDISFIWAYQKGKGYYGEKYPDSEIAISYGHDDEYIITDLKIDNILEMMTDYRDYVDSWEKETGKIKN